MTTLVDTMAMTLLERLELLRDLTPLDDGKRRHSWAALARRAGIARTGLGTAVSRLERGLSETIDPVTARALALAFGTTVDWVLFGDGEGPAQDTGTRYPNRDAAIAMAGTRWSDETIASLRRAAARFPTDLSVGTWISIGDEIERATRTGTEVGRPMADDDDTPPAGRR